MTTIQWTGSGFVFKDGLVVGAGLECCCEQGPPCCPCTDVAVPESCGALQSFIAVFSFPQIGGCPDPGAVTVTVTQADQDAGFPFSKTAVFNIGAAHTLTISVALFCDGVDFCYVLTGTVAFTGCSFCNGNVQSTGFTHRLNGTTNESGDCCPSGNETQHSIAFCDDFAMTLGSTLVY